MKKFMVVALLLAVGVSFAFASSIKVPWFVDSAPQNGGNPPASGALGVVYLTSNCGPINNNAVASETGLVCAIKYYNANGELMTNRTATAHASDPRDPQNDTFVIPSNASIAFRPFADDTPGATGTMEATAGHLVPNRGTNKVSDNAVDAAQNGSLVISWVDAQADGKADKAVQGAYSFFRNASDGTGRMICYGHLLPSGL